MTLIFMIIMICSIFFSLLSHPLILSMILLTQTISIILMTYNFFYNFYFSYILFLIMISGMLILFMYMTSIASNEKFLFKMSHIGLVIIIIIIMNLWVYDNYLYYYLNFSSSIMNNYNYTLNLSKFFITPNNFMMMIMMIYLFITLIATVKIINIKFGSLRQKF